MLSAIAGCASTLQPVMKKVAQRPSWSSSSSSFGVPTRASKPPKLMVTRRSECEGSLPVQALSASTSNDRNMAEVKGAGHGKTGAGAAALAGRSGIPASDLLSSIDCSFLDSIGGEPPLVQQRLV